MYNTRQVDLMVLEVNLQFIRLDGAMKNFTGHVCMVLIIQTQEGSYVGIWEKIGRYLKASWLIQGGFNSVCSNEDRIGGVPINEEAANNFQNWILSLELVEVQCNDPKFTWTNYQEV